MGSAPTTNREARESGSHAEISAGSIRLLHSAARAATGAIRPAAAWIGHAFAESYPKEATARGWGKPVSSPARRPDGEGFGLTEFQPGNARATRPTRQRHRTYGAGGLAGRAAGTINHFRTAAHSARGIKTGFLWRSRVARQPPRRVLSRYLS